MRLVKDISPGAYAVRVPCIGKDHAAHRKTLKLIPSVMFTLAEGYADLDGKAFVDYYCDACVEADPVLTAAILQRKTR